MAVSIESIRDRLPQPLRYLGVGATGVPIDLVVTTIATGAVGLLAAQVVGWFVAASWNYHLNARVTWNGSQSFAEWTSYLGVDVVRLGVRLGVVALVASVVPNVVATAIGIAAAATFGFLGFQNLVFNS